MVEETIKSKTFEWKHFSTLSDEVIASLTKNHQFHPLDIEDLVVESELSKVDVYKHYLFCVLNLPTRQSDSRIVKHQLSVFIGKDFLVTISDAPIDVLDTYFKRVQKSSGLKREVMGKSSGFLLYKIFDTVFRDSMRLLREVVRETELVETEVYDSHTRVTTKKLGELRRNVLFFKHTIDPLKILIHALAQQNRPYFDKSLVIYFDDLRDSLDNMSLILTNLKSIVDGLFDVNEAFLAHRTNDIIRFLTFLSVILMPPTLITGYYGMNVSNLPFSEDVISVTVIICSSLVFIAFAIMYFDRKRH